MLQGFHSIFGTAGPPVVPFRPIRGFERVIHPHYGPIEVKQILFNGSLWRHHL